MGLMTSPSTELYRSFIEHCTLTKKVAGDLMKGPIKTSLDATIYWSPSHLIVSLNSYKLDNLVRLMMEWTHLSLTDVVINILIVDTQVLYTIFKSYQFLWHRGFTWLLVFDLKPFNQTIWMKVFIATNCSKSVRNSNRSCCGVVNVYFL